MNEQNEESSQPTATRGDVPPPELKIADIIGIAWARRKEIIWISIIVGLVTFAVNLFLLPAYFKATASLLPETQKDKLSALGQFSDIASLAGVSVPGSSIARLYPTILSSETILRAVIGRKYKSTSFPDSIDLIRHFDLDEGSAEEDTAGALKVIRGLMSVSYDTKTSVVSVTIEMTEPRLAADVLNSMVAELDKFMRHKRFTNATEQVKWIDQRLKDIQEELRAAEETLVIFRQKNRRVADSPELLLQQERLVREVQVRGTVFIELKKQYELAKLEEIKNLTIVNVLDAARAPVKKERPTRILNTILATLLGMVGSLAYFVLASRHSKSIEELLASLGPRTRRGQTDTF